MGLGSLWDTTRVPVTVTCSGPRDGLMVGGQHETDAIILQLLLVTMEDHVEEQSSQEQ